MKANAGQQRAREEEEERQRKRFTGTKVLALLVQRYRF
jgi:hypothetical protein